MNSRLNLAIIIFLYYPCKEISKLEAIVLANKHQLNNKWAFLVIVLLTLLFPLSAASAGDLVIGKVRSAGYMGPNAAPVVVTPHKETETWNYGEFDPSQIWMTTTISSSRADDVHITVFVNVKAGNIVFSEKSGIDVKHLAKTARWQGEKSGTSAVLTMGPANRAEYDYKFSLDTLMGDLMPEKKWPYIITFKFVASHEGGKEVNAKKTIILVPDNKMDY